MRKKGLILFFSALSLLAILLLIQPSTDDTDADTDADTESEPVKFKIVTIQPKGKHIPKNLMMFADALEKEFEGKVIIEFLGGPEVIGPFQQPEAVRSGQIDMALTSPSFYSNLTVLSHVNIFSNLTFDVLQKNGFYDLHEEIHNEIGFVYLGEITFDVPFYMFTNFKVSSLNDFAGKKIRVFPTITPFVNSLGAAPVLMGQHEIYSAMERGVVDGFVMNAAGFVEAQSWHEVTKYMIKPGFYRGGLVLLANPDSWNKLPEDLQQRIKTYKSEVWNPDPNGGLWFFNYNLEQTKLIEKSGVEVIELSPEDTREYLTMAYESAWKAIIAKEPVKGPQLKKLLFNPDLLPQ